MSEDEKETKLDKKIELIVVRTLEKHVAKLRGPQPTDPKEGESSRTNQHSVSSSFLPRRDEELLSSALKLISRPIMGINKILSANAASITGQSFELGKAQAVGHPRPVQ